MVIQEEAGGRDAEKRCESICNGEGVGKGIIRSATYLVREGCELRERSTRSVEVEGMRRKRRSMYERREERRRREERKDKRGQGKGRGRKTRTGSSRLVMVVVIRQASSWRLSIVKR